MTRSNPSERLGGSMIAKTFRSACSGTTSAGGLAALRAKQISSGVLNQTAMVFTRFASAAARIGVRSLCLTRMASKMMACGELQASRLAHVLLPDPCAPTST